MAVKINANLSGLPAEHHKISTTAIEMEPYENFLVPNNFEVEDLTKRFSKASTPVLLVL